MKKIALEDIVERLAFENPWWTTGKFDPSLPPKPRPFLQAFLKLVQERTIQRAVVLMGPRRVGKTVLMWHAIEKLLHNGVDPRRICYISLDSPTYTDLRIDELVRHFRERQGFSDLKDCYFFLDEIQYHRNWEIHLKKLVEDYRDTRFIASGSAAAALRLKSQESGAGRFTDFYLPPLTFYEFLYLLDKEDLVATSSPEEYRQRGVRYKSNDIGRLNQEFINYLNFGGYPEVIASPAIRANPARYIRSDIIDKVLLRDLPSLYGIHDVQELNRLFTVLAYNTGNELSLESLSTGAGVAKNTIKKYLEYLEAAFLITILHRVDHNAKRFRRANFFKAYLTNPSMRCALFGPVNTDSPVMGFLTETAIVSQWMHSLFKDPLFYARWDKGGEVDMVYLRENQVDWCVEIKWSNRYINHPDELRGLLDFAKRKRVDAVGVTTIDKAGSIEYSGVPIKFIESSLYCYIVGRVSTRALGERCSGMLEDAH
ncbi:MAG: ATP-binding protein [Elusimicrobiota bacterium]|jgi:hypothetical protein